MKKIVSLCLVVTLLLSFGLVLSACKDKSEPLGDPTKDPAVMTEVYANTASAFFGDKAAAAVWESALKNGSLDIQFALEDAGGSPLSIRETIYSDAEAGKFVSETLLSLMGEELSATIWGAPGHLAIGSESIFGTKTAYGLTLSTLISGLKDSALAEMLEIPDEAMDSIIALLTALNPPADGKEDKDEAETTEMQGFVASLPEKVNSMIHMTATPETVESEDGKTKTEYLVVSYQLNNDSMKQFLDLLVDAATLIAGDKATEEDIADLTGSMAETMKDFNDTMDFDITEKVYILVKEKVVEKSEMTLNITPKETDAQETPVSGNITTTFSDTQIAMNVELVAMGETVKATATIDKKVEGEVTTYTVAVNGGTKNVTADLLTATLTYDKAAAKLTLAGDIIMDATNRTDIKVEADYKVSAEEVAFSLSSVTIDEDTFTFGDKNVFALTVKANAELPAEPADARDIVTLSEEEWGEFIAGVMESPLGQLIASAAPPSASDSIVSYQVTDKFFITVPQSMQQVQVDGYAVAFENEDAAVLVLNQSRRELMKDGIRDVRDYICELGKASAGLSMSEMESFDSGDLYFEFTADNGFRYLVTAYQTTDYYWAVYYAADEDAYEKTYGAVFYEAGEALFAVNGNP